MPLRMTLGVTHESEVKQLSQNEYGSQDSLGGNANSGLHLRRYYAQDESNERLQTGIELEASEIMIGPRG